MRHYLEATIRSHSYEPLYFFSLKLYMYGENDMSFIPWSIFRLKKKFYKGKNILRNLIFLKNFYPNSISCQFSTLVYFFNSE